MALSRLGWRFRNILLALPPYDEYIYYGFKDATCGSSEPKSDGLNEPVGEART